MANKKTKTKKSQIKKLIILIVALTLVALALYNIYQSHSTREARTRLTNASTVLDQTIKTIEKEAPHSGKILKQATCNRETTKYSDGWIVCSQSLTLSGKGNSNEEITRKIQSFSKVINSQSQLNSLGVKDIGKLQESMVLNIQKVRNQDSYMPPCVVTFKVYPLEYRVAENQGVYELILSCTEKGVPKKLY